MLALAQPPVGQHLHRLHPLAGRAVNDERARVAARAHRRVLQWDDAARVGLARATEVVQAAVRQHEPVPLPAAAHAPTNEQRNKETMKQKETIKSQTFMLN